MSDLTSTDLLRNRDVLRAYARWAPVYDFVFGSIMAKGRRMAARLVADDAGAVLEMGVGTGLALPNYRANCRVTGIDLSAAMLDVARRRVRRRRLENVDALLEMDACSLDFAGSTFDAAVIMHAVTCVPDPSAMLGEAVRVVRPGGQVIVLSRFASETGNMAKLGRLLAPAGRWLGINTRVTASSLERYPGLELVADRPVGLAGYYRILEFKVGAP